MTNIVCKSGKAVKKSVMYLKCCLCPLILRQHMELDLNQFHYPLLPINENTQLSLTFLNCIHHMTSLHDLGLWAALDSFFLTTPIVISEVNDGCDF